MVFSSNRPNGLRHPVNKHHKEQSLGAGLHLGLFLLHQMSCQWERSNSVWRRLGAECALKVTTQGPTVQPILDSWPKPSWENLSRTTCQDNLLLTFWILGAPFLKNPSKSLFRCPSKWLQQRILTVSKFSLRLKYGNKSYMHAYPELLVTVCLVNQGFLPSFIFSHSRIFQ